LRRHQVFLKRRHRDASVALKRQQRRHNPVNFAMHPLALE
jgi:hypothetical protein